MTLTAQAVSSLLEAFRSSAPTPGGGSAAALAGAVGASLLAMVAGLPKPRATSEDDLRRLGEAGARCTELARQLEALIDRDADAYDRVIAAYRLPKASEDEKAARREVIQKAVRGAIEVPLDVMRACRAAIDVAPAILACGNPNASSDVNVGIELLRAARRGAHFNLEINLESLKDRAYAERAAAEAALLESVNERSE